MIESSTFFNLATSIRLQLSLAGDQNVFAALLASTKIIVRTSQNEKAQLFAVRAPIGQALVRTSEPIDSPSVLLGDSDF